MKNKRKTREKNKQLFAFRRLVHKIKTGRTNKHGTRKLNKLCPQRLTQP